MSEVNKKKLFQEHTASLARNTAAALETEGFAGLVVHSGIEREYFADDLHVPFHPVPHFAHWCPLRLPGHLLLVKAGDKPKLYLHEQPSFWVDNSISIEPFWADSFEIIREKNDIAQHFKSSRNLAYIGPEVPWLPEGIANNPKSLLEKLDRNRRTKTPYEIFCLTAANEIAARGHEKIRECFKAEKSELEIHLAYMQATGATERKLPYNNIVASDEKAAILHYQNKRTTGTGTVLLADCGAMYSNYGADVTRTYVRKNGHPVFIQLLKGLETVQQKLCAEVTSGVPFYDLHYSAHEKVASLLKETEITSISGEEAIASGITKLFFPHGLGHLLGVQVHDVSGACLPCRYQKPFLEIFANVRFKGKITAGEVVTIEPGIYFIPMLLDPQRHKNSNLNWKLIDELIPLGGMRIEDDILVKASGFTNLTRKFLSNKPVLE